MKLIFIRIYSSVFIQKYLREGADVGDAWISKIDSFKL